MRKTRWLQWTASPPSIADLDGDGHNEVIGLPNAEMKEPYETQNYAFMVLDGAQNGGVRSARRHRGFTNPPLSRKPAVRSGDDYYPPSGIPAPTVVDIAGDRRPEIVSAVPDGFVYAVGPTGRRLWRYDYAHGAARTFASEVVAADLNRDGTPELVFGTYALKPRSGRLVVLSAAGKRLYDIRLRHQGADGNGIGVPAAPSIADLDGDGRLEIVLSSFDHGLDVYRVPGSGTNCLPWPTGPRQPAAQRDRAGDGLTRRYSTASTSAAWAVRSSIATTSSARACVAPSTTAGAQPASWASSQRAAHTHQRSPGESPGKPHSGRGVDRSLPAIALNSRNSAVITAQTVWLPTSSGPVAQQPSR